LEHFSRPIAAEFQDLIGRLGQALFWALPPRKSDK
jgi:hypothetical protein